MPNEPSVAAQLARLPELKMPELWALWDRHFPQRPRHHNRGYLQSRLVYQIQAKAYGALPEATQRKLEALGEHGGEKGRSGLAGLKPGTVLVRCYEGVEHRVTAKADGSFEHAGQSYRSLSAVARAITGTRWNGHRFFGLRKEAR